MTVSQVIGLFCFFIVALLALIFVGQRLGQWRRRRIIEVGVPTTGEVVAVKEVTPEGGPMSFQVKVEFDDHQGNRVRGRFGTYKRLRVGTQTPVTFDPDRPKRMVVTDPSLLEIPNRDAQMRKVWAIVSALVISGVVLIAGRWGGPI